MEAGIVALVGVSVIVVSYKTPGQLRRCLEAIEREHEIIVVDNASGDGSAEMVERNFPHVSLIRSETNVGFGRANNLGLAQATRELALLLNSDAYAHPGAIDLLAQGLKEGDIAAGGRLQHLDGRLQNSACAELTLWAVFCEQTFLERLFPASALFSPYWQSQRMPQGGEVEQVMGACLLMRRINGEFLRFDPRFFLYAEDTELCKRLRKHGTIRYVPEAVFDHELGASSSATRWRSVALYNFGKELYFQIHYGEGARIVCWHLNRFGAFLRILAGGLVTPKAQLFWKVLFARSSKLPQGAPQDAP